MAIVDRRYSVSEGTAVKAPCRAATTANITLSGEQTIDGVAVVEDDRVLVKDQDTASENGIYVASTGNWTRARDFDGAYDIVTGTRMLVINGTVASGKEYYVTTTGSITIGTTSLAFDFFPSNGDIEGPASSVDGELVLFSGTTGALLKRATNSGVLYAASGVLASEAQLDVTRGGTGASTASAARSNLGLAIGTNVQAYQPVQSTAAWQAATSTTESVVSPAKVLALVAANASASVDIQPLTSNGTWTKPVAAPSTAIVLVLLWGGGGGGATTSGGGGGGGAYNYGWFLASDLGSTETVTVGTGGATSTAGGTTSFGTLLYAYGGAAGGAGSTSGGGGGGGTLSAGTSTGSSNGGDGGRPSPGSGGPGGNAGGHGNSGGGGGGQAGAGFRGGDGIFGGGGGGGAGSFGTGGEGGYSQYGGGGGGGGAVTGGAGGQSCYGGDGGAKGVAGTAPAGGGGENAVGARGEALIITIW